jgi:tagatose-6-phosphate ketose/aldose isomerase
MNAFEALLSLPDAEKKTKGVEHTPREIAQQPATWAKAAGILSKRRGEILEFMRAAGLSGERKANLVMTGAGSSEFVGNAVASGLRVRLKRDVVCIPTTHIVTHPQTVFIPGQNYVVLSFARSGNSPESVATYNLVKQVCPQAKQIAITCNKDGALAKAAKIDANSFYIELPEETNDRSLVMTSSYSTMAFTATGLGLLETPDELTALAAKLGAAGERVIKEYGGVLQKFAQRSFNRACFLGSGTLYGTMQECHLKLQEMTEGQVAAMFNSFVGLRHGPLVFCNKDCVIVAALSSGSFARKYELDMLRELKAKKQGGGTLVICAKADAEIRDLSSEVVELFPNGDPVDDDFRVMSDVMVGQIFATFKCMLCGLKPDNPSVSGTINRVVQGVTIYPYS